MSKQKYGPGLSFSLDIAIVKVMCCFLFVIFFLDFQSDDDNEDLDYVAEGTELATWKEALVAEWFVGGNSNQFEEQWERERMQKGICSGFEAFCT